MKENWWINFKKEQKSVFDQESDLGSYLGLVPTVLVSLVCHKETKDILGFIHVLTVLQKLG